MRYKFRLAKIEELNDIWQIIEKAIARRKADGSNQWQDNYPNLDVLKNDINKNKGYVIYHKEALAGYCVVSINDEVEYKNIKGKWLSNTDYVVFHRLAVAESFLGKGIAKKWFEFIETFAKENNIYSIKADTNFDNQPMLHLFNKIGYKECGKVYFRGSERIAFEKLLT